MTNSQALIFNGNRPSFTQQTLITLVARLAVFCVATTLFAPPLLAQSACAFPACNLPGERYDVASGECRSGPDPVTRARSHRTPTCPNDERFDRATGQCVLAACGNGCEARVLCPRDTRYSRSERDAGGGVYGVCERGSSGPGYRSHEVVRCPTGFTLNEARGVCVGNCPLRLPDLVIRRAFLRATPGGPAVTQIRVGQRYWACFEVANVGTAASGLFEVGGGGLGVPTAPSQAHASLGAGAVREGCFAFPTTPAIGRYRIGISADSRGAVTESREDNNDASLVVNVIR